MLNFRGTMVGLLALASAVAVIRSTYVLAYAETKPVRAATAWANHPDVLISRALTEIGAAAVRQESPPADALQSLQTASRLAQFSCRRR